MLYSGSMDNTIRVWDIDTMECIRTLDDHTNAVTSLLCWDQYLLSSSLDCTTKVWFATEEEKLEVAYTHKEEDGVLALSGMIANGHNILDFEIRFQLTKSIFLQLNLKTCSKY